MPEYKVYEVGPDGRLTGIPPGVITAADDDEAIAQLRCATAELWCGNRLVHRPASPATGEKD